MKSVSPWPAKTECPIDRYVEFKQHLMAASFHNARDNGSEVELASKATHQVANVAVVEDWPYWVIQRMFSEIRPCRLVIFYASLHQHFKNNHK